MLWLKQPLHALLIKVLLRLRNSRRRESNKIGRMVLMDPMLELWVGRKFSDERNIT